MHKRIRRGVFAELWGATVSFVLSVGLSVRLEKLDSHWTDFREIWCVSTFQTSVEKTIQVLLTWDNKWYFTRGPKSIFIIFRQFLLTVRIFLDKICRESRNTHFMFSNFFSQNPAVYEIMWKKYRVSEKDCTLFFIFFSLVPSMWRVV
jgi:hypothetical protein